MSLGLSLGLFSRRGVSGGTAPTYDTLTNGQWSALELTPQPSGRTVVTVSVAPLAGYEWTAYVGLTNPTGDAPTQLGQANGVLTGSPRQFTSVTVRPPGTTVYVRVAIQPVGNAAARVWASEVKSLVMFETVVVTPPSIVDAPDAVTLDLDDYVEIALADALAPGHGAHFTQTASSAMLPRGWTLDYFTGLIYGSAAEPFSGTIIVRAENAGGAVNISVPLTIVNTNLLGGSKAALAAAGVPLVVQDWTGDPPTWDELTQSTTLVAEFPGYVAVQQTGNKSPGATARWPLAGLKPDVPYRFQARIRRNNYTSDNATVRTILMWLSGIDSDPAASRDYVVLARPFDIFNDDSQTEFHDIDVTFTPDAAYPFFYVHHRSSSGSSVSQSITDFYEITGQPGVFAVLQQVVATVTAAPTASAIPNFWFGIGESVDIDLRAFFPNATRFALDATSDAMPPGLYIAGYRLLGVVAGAATADIVIVGANDGANSDTAAFTITTGEAGAMDAAASAVPLVLDADIEPLSVESEHATYYGIAADDPRLLPLSPVLGVIDGTAYDGPLPLGLSFAAGEISGSILTTAGDEVAPAVFSGRAYAWNARSFVSRDVKITTRAQATPFIPVSSLSSTQAWMLRTATENGWRVSINGTPSGSNNFSVFQQSAGAPSTSGVYRIRYSVLFDSFTYLGSGNVPTLTVRSNNMNTPVIGAVNAPVSPTPDVVRADFTVQAQVGMTKLAAGVIGNMTLGSTFEFWRDLRVTELPPPRLLTALRADAIVPQTAYVGRAYRLDLREGFVFGPHDQPVTYSVVTGEAALTGVGLAITSRGTIEGIPTGALTAQTITVRMNRAASTFFPAFNGGVAEQIDVSFTLGVEAVAPAQAWGGTWTLDKGHAITPTATGHSVAFAAVTDPYVATTITGLIPGTTYRIRAKLAVTTPHASDLSPWALRVLLSDNMRSKDNMWDYWISHMEIASNGTQVVEGTFTAPYDTVLLGLGHFALGYNNGLPDEPTSAAGAVLAIEGLEIVALPESIETPGTTAVLDRVHYYGTTFVFDAPRTVLKLAAGGYLVEGGGSVIAMLPVCETVNGRTLNGAETNWGSRNPESLNPDNHGFDSLPGFNNLPYSATYNVDPHFTGQPVPMTAAGSVTKAISARRIYLANGIQQLEQMNSLWFRPTLPGVNDYDGEGNPLRLYFQPPTPLPDDPAPPATGIDLSILPALAVPADLGAEYVDYDRALYLMKREPQQTGHNPLRQGFSPRYNHGTFGRFIQQQMSRAAMLLVSDAITTDQKRALATALVQHAIHISSIAEVGRRYTVATGEPGRRWIAGGGGSGGRAPFVALAAALSGLPYLAENVHWPDARQLDKTGNYADDAWFRSRVGDPYPAQVGSADYGPRRYLIQDRTGTSSPPSATADRPNIPYHAWLAGLPDWANHDGYTSTPTEGSTSRDLQRCTASASWEKENYRQISQNSASGLYLAMHLVPQAKAVWGNQRALDYMDWHMFMAKRAPLDTDEPFSFLMWRDHRSWTPAGAVPVSAQRWGLTEDASWPGGASFKRPGRVGYIRHPRPMPVGQATQIDLAANEFNVIGGPVRIESDAGPYGTYSPATLVPMPGKPTAYAITGAWALALDADGQLRRHAVTVPGWASVTNAGVLTVTPPDARIRWLEVTGTNANGADVATVTIRGNNGNIDLTALPGDAGDTTTVGDPADLDTAAGLIPGVAETIDLGAGVTATATRHGPFIRIVVTDPAADAGTYWTSDYALSLGPVMLSAPTVTEEP
jgi:hypothetical protein